MNRIAIYFIIVSAFLSCQKSGDLEIEEVDDIEDANLTITVMLIDSNFNIPISYASIAVVNNDSVFWTETDSNGSFVINNPNEARYAIYKRQVVGMKTLHKVYFQHTLNQENIAIVNSDSSEWHIGCDHYSQITGMVQFKNKSNTEGLKVITNPSNQSINVEEDGKYSFIVFPGKNQIIVKSRLIGTTDSIIKPLNLEIGASIKYDTVLVSRGSLSDYFPLHIGNTWNYKREYSNPETSSTTYFSRTIIGDTLIQNTNKIYSIIETNYIKRIYIRLDNKENIIFEYLPNREEEQPHKFLSYLTYYLDDYDIFGNTYKCRVAIGPVQSDYTRMLFGKGIGYCFSYNDKGSTIETITLQSCTINGVEYK